MDLEIGFEKRNGDMSGITIRIDDEGFLWVVEPKTSTCIQLPFWLENYKSGSAFLLGVDYDNAD